MVELIPIEREELKDLIKVGFEGDELLLQYFHISPGALDHCVQHTHNLIDPYYDDEEIKPDLGAYAIVTFDTETGKYKKIGFSVIYTPPAEMNRLYSFAINIDYRKKEIIGSWLEKLTELLGKCYFTQLWDCNTRAIDFFQKNDFILAHKEGCKILIRCQQED